MREKESQFQSQGLKLAGVLRLPDQAQGPVPGVLLIHGAQEQDRDGNLLQHPDGRSLVKKELFLKLAKRLTSMGLAVFSWDKRGFGESEGPKGNLLSTATDARAALDILANQDGVVDPSRLVVLGQSAGVYTATLLAREDQRPAFHIFQGGLYSRYVELMTHNYQMVLDYARRGPVERGWLEEHDPWGLAMGENLKALEKAARSDGAEVLVSCGNRQWTLRPETLCYQPGYAPTELFKYVKTPVLILHGERDLNVPVEDAFAIKAKLEQLGNRDVTLRSIPEADHNFKLAPENEETRLREKFSLESFKRPFVEDYFQALANYLQQKVLCQGNESK